MNSRLSVLNFVIFTFATVLFGFSPFSNTAGFVTAQSNASVGQNTNDQDAQSDTSSAQDIFQTQTTKYHKAFKEFSELLLAAPADERAELWKKAPSMETYAAPLWKLVEEHPDEDITLNSLIWMVTYSNHHDAKTIAKSCETLITNFIDRKELESVVMRLGRQDPSAQSYDALTKLMNDSPHDKVKGMATFAMANFLLESKTALADKKELEADGFGPLESDLDFEFIETLDMSDANIKSLYQTAVDDFGDIKPYPSSSRRMKEIAEGALFEFDNLRIGMEAPEIEGDDLEGTSFKLSEYRGKVVALIFWGDWSGPCRAMYPHEQSLVKKLADKPFALIGVNSDRNKKNIKKATENKKIGWRNFWDGKRGIEGPISTRWNISGWPTVYILDEKGVIRFKDKRGADMDAAVTELLAEMGHDVDLSNHLNEKLSPTEASESEDKDSADDSADDRADRLKKAGIVEPDADQLKRD